MMRVVVYVPASRSAGRTRRSVERDVLRQGHDIVGYAQTPTEARAAIDTRIAERVAGRPEHLASLVPWTLVIPVPRTRPEPLVILAVLAAWWVGNRRPVLTTSAMLLAGAATAAALMGGSSDPPARGRRPVVTPPIPAETGPPPVAEILPPVAELPPLPMPAPTVATSSVATSSPTAEPTPQPTTQPTTGSSCLLDVEVQLLTLTVCPPAR